MEETPGDQAYEIEHIHTTRGEPSMIV